MSTYDPSYSPDDNTPGEPIDPSMHPAHNVPSPTVPHWGTQLADVTPLHPPGTFARNTQGGDIVNGMARELGVKTPNNVIKFPKK